MADRNLKVQLGARVRETAKGVAVAAADRAGMSLNEWVEQAILRLAHDEARKLDGQTVLEGQTTVDDFVGERPSEGSVADGGGERHDSQPAPTKTFAKDCVLAEYHWKHGPGNPCRRCGGETA